MFELIKNQKVTLSYITFQTHTYIYLHIYIPTHIKHLIFLSLHI